MVEVSLDVVIGGVGDQLDGGHLDIPTPGGGGAGHTHRNTV